MVAEKAGEKDAQNRHTLVCMFCGAPAPLSASNERRPSAKVEAEPQSPVMLIRCPVCLKEAPYRREKVSAAAA